MNVKKWFEDGTGLKIKELRYVKTPPLPYNIYIDDMTYRGADRLNNIIEHNITFEHYHNGIKESKEKIIEDFLNKEEIQFDKSREWLDEEEIWVTIYELEPYLEKIRKESDK